MKKVLLKILNFQILGDTVTFSRSLYRNTLVHFPSAIIFDTLGLSINNIINIYIYI